MTEVAFHFNAPDKLAYACRFARKVLRNRAKLVILGDERALATVSTRLWSLSATDFLAHAKESDRAEIQALSPILLLGNLAAATHHDVLLNLTAEVPAGFEAFAKVVEVVASFDDVDRSLARNRWKQYAHQGYGIVRHDLQLKEAL